ncbi:b02d05e5-f9f0-4a0e-a536-713537cd595b [Sclerotinia trifoliorum]|uniref:B02d05e5-f9f0-4a0e-a536-713537cd595b n=1 Tax=Sclerotinia trifoliorum TaxID=28548 RepID=A0A8H2VYI9_9HELO|nr:b02d05e5-f9f0-4a0e-a536-713537cd595b [Sclerotinia trifoliorum]
MRFLCLHGTGTNSQIFEMQSAALRSELGDRHSFQFLEGVISVPPAPEIATYLTGNDVCFTYFDYGSEDSISKALEDLARYVVEEGPFDGIMAFSHGASLASMFIIQSLQKNREALRRSPQSPEKTPFTAFQCAIFLCGVRPTNVCLAANADGHIRFLDGHLDGVVIDMPTAHIFASNDGAMPGESEKLSELCAPDNRVIFIHDQGHEVPKSKEAVLGAVHAIRRVIDSASAT